MKNALKSIFNISALGIGVPGTVLGGLSSLHELTTPLAEKDVMLFGTDFTLVSLAIFAVSAGLSYVGHRGIEKLAVEKYKAQNAIPPAP